MKIFWLGVALGHLFWLGKAEVDFNVEIEKRVMERLADFMEIPVNSVADVLEYRTLGGFANDMEAPDRNLVLRWLKKEAPLSLYIGLESGSYYYHDWPTQLSHYREPGPSGYDAINIPSDMKKYFGACVDGTTGLPKNCTKSAGDAYVKCVNNCAYRRCPDDASQQDCSVIQNNETRKIQCEQSVKWCSDYTIEQVPEGAKMGYVPTTGYCLNSMGIPTETLGERLFPDGELGDCTSDDGSLLNRTLTGEYAYCGGTVCSTTYTGGHKSQDYDPRFRPWYIDTKTAQTSMWSEPYLFWGDYRIGITYTAPIYSQVQGRTLFAGVAAVDYALEYIAEFLATEYGETDEMVFIVEADEPNYLIGASTGTPVARKVIVEDPKAPCPENPETVWEDPDGKCTIARLPLLDLQGHPNDEILRRTFVAHADAGFPTDTLVYVKESDEIGSNAYISQGSIFEQEGANLKWHVFVITQMERSNTDAAYRGDEAFFAISALGAVGFTICFAMFVTFWSYRKEKAVIHADWRFTCAYLCGCSALNLSTFTQLGENNDGTCMIRMWTFNSLFTIALSPLFVKVWRMYKLTKASTGFRRVNVTHFQAFLYTLPFILVECAILLVFSFVDPPRAVEDLADKQTITCEHETDGFMITQLTFDALLVFAGCVLAYATRDLDPRFGEAKQLSFAMYNIAFTGIVLVALSLLVDMDWASKMVLNAIGVLWATVFSAIAFVLPRMLEVADKKDTKQSTRKWEYLDGGNQQVLVSGLAAGSTVFSAQGSSVLKDDSQVLTGDRLPVPSMEPINEQMDEPNEPEQAPIMLDGAPRSSDDELKSREDEEALRDRLHERMQCSGNEHVSCDDCP